MNLDNHLIFVIEEIKVSDLAFLKTLQNIFFFVRMLKKITHHLVFDWFEDLLRRVVKNLSLIPDKKNVSGGRVRGNSTLGLLNGD